jgi:adenosylcobinamide-GDP ribazoletransferase
MLLGIFAAHVVSRTWPLLLIRLMPHVGDVAGSKSKPLADQISTGSLFTAGIWCFVALAPVIIACGAMNVGAVQGWDAAALLPLATALLASGLAWAYMGRLLWRRLQGFTGDGLGATQQVCEIAFYLGLALAL